MKQYANINGVNYLIGVDYAIGVDRTISERKIMPNIKITAEIDGKQVPLENISTETFEAIKALEIPVARIGNYIGYPNERRLFLRINRQLRKTIRDDAEITVTIDLNTGYATNWDFVDGSCCKKYYENIRPL